MRALGLLEGEAYPVGEVASGGRVVVPEPGREVPGLPGLDGDDAAGGWCLCQVKLEREFPDGASELDGPGRRGFMKVMDKSEDNLLFLGVFEFRN